MNKSLIRTEAEREARKQLVERNREQRKQLKMLQSLGLVCYKNHSKKLINPTMN
jgi:hypothetical protein